MSNTQYEPNADVLDQSKKIAVLAEEFGFSEQLIRSAIRAHDDIADRVDDAPDTDIRALQVALAAYGFGEFESYQKVGEQ